MIVNAQRLRARFAVDIHHRVAGETAELATPGPLPADIAAIASGDATFQLGSGFAVALGGGYARALDGGRSFPFATAALMLTFAGRCDLGVQGLLEPARGGGRALDPTVFVTTALHF